MQQYFKKIYNEFVRIKEMGWVESVKKGYGGVGLTLETLLGISSNELRSRQNHLKVMLLFLVVSLKVIIMK